MENADTVSLDDIRELRAKSQKSFINEKLKTAVLGGFDKKDVLRHIDEMRNSELKMQETYTGRINELVAQIESLQSAAEKLRSELASADQLKRKTDILLKSLDNECGAMKHKIENDGEVIVALGKKCGAYETQIKSMQTNYEEVQSARNIKEQYEKLSEDYNEAEKSLNENVKVIAVLRQENEEIRSRNNSLNEENEFLSKSLSELKADARKRASNADLKLSAFCELQKNRLCKLRNFSENSLKHLEEMEAEDNELQKALTTEFCESGKL